MFSNSLYRYTTCCRCVCMYVQVSSLVTCAHQGPEAGLDWHGLTLWCNRGGRTRTAALCRTSFGTQHSFRLSAHFSPPPTLPSASPLSLSLFAKVVHWFLCQGPTLLGKVCPKEGTRVLFFAKVKFGPCQRSSLYCLRPSVRTCGWPPAAWAVHSLQRTLSIETSSLPSSSIVRRERTLVLTYLLLA